MTKRPFVGTAVLVAAAALATSCSLPRVYRLAVQQGNVITQEMVDSLKPGMTREQVAFIMGEPVVRNPFDNNRWDYVYTLRVPGYVDDQVKMSLFFVDDELARFFTSNFKPTNAEVDAEVEDSADGAASADTAP